MAKGEQGRPNSDYRLVLARRLTRGQAFLVLILSVGAGGIAAVGSFTSQPWLCAPVVALAGLVAWFGRHTVTADAPKEGPLWRFTPQNVALARRHVEEAIRHVASDLGLPEATVRGDVFAPDKTQHILRMVAGMSVRMTDAELQLRIPEGFGVSGAAYQSRKPAVAAGSALRGGTIYAEDGSALVTPFWIGETESAKLNPQLEWVIAAPICDANGSAVGVLCVDGLQLPAMASAVVERLKGVQHHVIDGAARIAALLVSSG